MREKKNYTGGTYDRKFLSHFLKNARKRGTKAKLRQTFSDHCRKKKPHYH